ncbi:uncharacterized protein CBL_00506 [Carabus blaptoides fortunei]
MEIEELNTTKRIVKELYRQCVNEDIRVSEDFLSYYVKLLLLDPSWNVTDDDYNLHRENVENLVDYCIETLYEGRSPSLKTLQIQHYIQTRATSKSNLIEANRQLLKECLKPLQEDIFRVTLTELNRSDNHKLFDRIVLYITILSGLGNPEEDAVLQEATFALKSIFGESDLSDFVQLKPDEKIIELTYLQNLVAGIRLFNRDCGKPAAPIEDLPKILSNAFHGIQTILQNELLQVMEKVNLTTSAIENVYVLERNDETGYSYVLNLPQDVSEEFLRYIMELLILSRQYEVYIRKLLADIKDIETSGNKLFNDLQKIFIKLHASVKMKVAVPTNIVYPLFIQLSEIWQKIQDEIVLLSTYNQIFKEMQEKQSLNSITDKILKLMIGKGEILTDAKRLERTMGLKIKEENNKCDILNPLRIKDFDKIPLQYLGFCAFSLVETKGGLIPGNPNMGICKWHDKCYVFSSPEAASAFGQDPKTYVLRALEGIRTRPELINLLQMHDQIRSVRSIGVLYEKPAEVVLTYNVGMQTELHPIPTHIDPDYTWNVWDLYRQAIKLANISNCKTHSTQTNKSHFRYSVHVQTTELRNKECQTKKDNYTNVATPSNFIFGLRGRRDDVQHIVDLTRPVDESKYYKCAASQDYPYKHLSKLTLKPNKLETTKIGPKSGTKENAYLKLQSRLVAKLDEEKKYNTPIVKTRRKIMNCTCIASTQTKRM